MKKVSHQDATSLQALLSTQALKRRQRATLVTYLNMKVEAEDWHGVSDAANDLREVDEALRTLKLAIG